MKETLRQTFYSNPKHIIDSNKQSNENQMRGKNHVKVKPINTKLLANPNPLDTEKFIDENIKLKQELNKIKYEHNVLKVDYKRIQDENRKKLQVVEDILLKSGKSDIEIMTYYNDVINGVDNSAKIELTSQNYVKLKEMYIIANLKSQIHELKRLLYEKEDLLIKLKSTDKISTYSKMERQYNSMTDELENLKLKCQSLKESNSELESKNEILENERDYLKHTLNSYKNYVQEMKAKLNSQENSIRSPMHNSFYINRPKTQQENSQAQSSKINLKLANQKLNRAKQDENQEKIEKLNVENMSMRKELDQVKSINENLTNDIEILNKKLNELTSKKISLEDTNANSSKELEAMKNKIWKLNIELEESKNKGQDLYIENKRLKDDLERLEDSIKELHEDYEKKYNTSRGKICIIILENLLNLLQEKENLQIKLKNYEKQQDNRKDSNQSNESLNVNEDIKEEKQSALENENSIIVKPPDGKKDSKKEHKDSEEVKQTDDYTKLTPKDKEYVNQPDNPKTNLLDSQYGFRRQNSPNKKRLSENVFNKKKKAYKLQVNTCDNELIDPKDAFYQVDETFDPNIEVKPKKQLSTRDFQKSTTIERYLEEKLNSGNFDDILDEFQEHIKNK